MSGRVNDMRRIMIIGSGGAGKSTLARRIAEGLSLPLVGLDAHYWSAGWTPTSKAAWVAHVDELLRRDAWVMDGNYGGTMDLRLARCDTVVFLDLPRVVCLWRVVKRWMKYRGRSRPDLPDGCAERLTWEFATWIWTYPTRRRPEILARLTALTADQRVVHLTSQRAVAGFVGELTASEGR